MIRTTIINTPIGEMFAAATGEGICLLEFSERKSLESELTALALTFKSSQKKGGKKQLRILKKQLKEYFEGKRKTFSVPLIIHGTEFQEEIWKVLGTIPYGTTISYLNQAKLISNPGAVRAVANANGSNRIAILIPCHRVIGSDGDLTGYGGGLDRKRWLIDHEKKYSGQPVNGTLF